MERIVYLGELDRTPDACDHLGIRQGLESFKGLVVDPVLNPPSVYLKQVIDFKPDLVIHGNTDTLGQNVAPAIKAETGAKQVFWMLDYQPDKEHYTYWNKWIEDKGVYDAIFLSNKDQLDMWSEEFDCPTYFLTHGCVVKPMVKNHKFYHKAVFIGGYIPGDWYNDRFELLNEIGGFDHINESTVEGRNQVWKDMPAIYHTSDCVIDISHTWKAEGYASGRYFYSAGLGGCSITRRFPGCEELYPEGTKAYFETAEEAKKLMEYYQTHEKEREEMKRKAWEWNRDHHHYKLKFDYMIKCLNKSL